MFLPYNQEPINYIEWGDRKIACFPAGKNLHIHTVESFSEEWLKFNSFSETEIKKVGDEYFDICKDLSPENTVVLDVGCGSGRWSRYLSDKVKAIEAIDPGESVIAAAKLLSSAKNVRVSKADVSNIPFNDNSFDLVFSLGVLHHVPDTQKAIEDCVKKLKPGGYFLVYLYYNFDNRSRLYKILFVFTDVLRKFISVLPSPLKKFLCDLIAVFIYMPFVLVSRLFNYLNLKNWARHWPLSYYSNKSFFIMRNDALDRFGTPLEKRFSKQEIQSMLEKAGLTEIVFSENPPYWHAIGKKI